jgi:ribosomal protein S18 acetylase RimI-like enzyme
MLRTDRSGRLDARLEIRVGDSASAVLRAQQRALKRLIALEVHATYDPPAIACWRLRGHLKDALRPSLEWLGRRWPASQSAITAPLLNWIYPSRWFDGWTLRQERRWAWADTLKLVDQSRFAVGLVRGRLVAVIGYKLGGKMADGREVFELTKASTLPEYRNLGLNGRLWDAIIERVAERHGTAPVISFTRNPSIIRRCRILGWRPLILEEYGEILGRIGRQGPPEESMEEFRRHWRAFLYDPEVAETPGGFRP